MKKKAILLSSMLMLSFSMAQAQKAYTRIEQNSSALSQLGTAAFDLSDTPSVEFDSEGKAVMTIGGQTVAALPMSDGGQMVVEFETSTAESALNKVSKTVSNPFATIYSPFQLQLPASSAVEVYAPTYDSESESLLCDDGTKIAASAICPVGTPLLLKDEGTISFSIVTDAANVSAPDNALSGSALKVSLPEIADGMTLYTLGHEKDDATQYGFFEYGGTSLGAGFAYLIAETVETVSSAKRIALSFGGSKATGIKDIATGDASGRITKYVSNGRVVISKDGNIYNVNGQQLK